jgi:hypothetical protein
MRAGLNARYKSENLVSWLSGGTLGSFLALRLGDPVFTVVGVAFLAGWGFEARAAGSTGLAVALWVSAGLVVTSEILLAVVPA